MVDRSVRQDRSRRRSRSSRGELRGTTFTSLSPCHTIAQPTRWITTTNSKRTNTRQSNTRNARHSKGSISWDHQLSQPSCTFFSQYSGVGNYRHSVLSRTYNNQNDIFINLSYNSNTDHSIKYPSATVFQPVFFSSWKISINIHTTHFCTLQW